ncbi:MAG: hypothetical protein GYA23_03775 [Methanomicrobiales archaeon]|nr:hypothetical protein [Methanomicrobiales archaeon]
MDRHIRIMVGDAMVREMIMLCIVLVRPFPVVTGAAQEHGGSGRLQRG